MNVFLKKLKFITANDPLPLTPQNKLPHFKCTHLTFNPFLKQL